MTWVIRPAFPLKNVLWDAGGQTKVKFNGRLLAKLNSNKSLCKSIVNHVHNNLNSDDDELNWRNSIVRDVINKENKVMGN